MQHLLIDSGLRKKFIVRFNLPQTDGKNYMINVLLFIQTPVESLNYHKQVKTSFVDRVVDKEKVVSLWRRRLQRSKKNMSLEEQSIITVTEKG